MNMQILSAILDCHCHHGISIILTTTIATTTTLLKTTASTAAPAAAAQIASCAARSGGLAYALKDACRHAESTSRLACKQPQEARHEEYSSEDAYMEEVLEVTFTGSKCLR